MAVTRDGEQTLGDYWDGLIPERAVSNRDKR